MACPIVGNEAFTSMTTTERNDRVTVIGVLAGEPVGHCVGEHALASRRQHSALPAQLGQHGNHPHEKLYCLPMPLVLKSAQSANDVEHRRTLHGRAPCNREMPRTIGLGSSTGSLCDVERNGKRGAPKLVA